ECPLHDAGKVRDAKLNQTIAAEILSRWRKAAGVSAPQGLVIESAIRLGGQVVGWKKLAIGRGGRLRAEYEIDGRRTVVGCAGKSCWDDLPDRAPRAIERGQAILDPHFAQGIAMALLLQDDAASQWGELALDAADKADVRLCYRLSLTDSTMR